VPDNKEIDVCQEIMDKMGYPNLELGLSAMSKDQLADSLAFNSLKVYIFLFLYLLILVRRVCVNRFVVILIIICMFFFVSVLSLARL
jgi:hypothetical protein